jgi:hypothetical protein
VTATEYAAAPVEAAQAGAVGRAHTLMLLQDSPVYPRVARLLGVATVPARRGGPHHETEIAARLAKLPPGWSVITGSVPGVDHLVIGPTGVFAVCTVHHPRGRLTVCGDRIRAAGRRHRHVADARRRASQVAEVLSTATDWDVPVHGVVAVMGAPAGFRVERQPADVTVVSRRTLTAFLHSGEPVLSTESMRRVHRIAARRTTWDAAG